MTKLTDDNAKLQSEAEELMRLAEQAKGPTGYGVTPAFLIKYTTFVKHREDHAFIRGHNFCVDELPEKMDPKGLAEMKYD